MPIDQVRIQNKIGVAFDFAGRQLRQLIETYPDYFPMYTVGGKWKHGGEAWTNWCEGFLGGQLWLLYRHTGDPYWRGQGRALLAPDRAPQDRPRRARPGLPVLVHLEALVRPDRRPGDQPGGDRGRADAGLRFKERGQYLRSFVADESLFIDIMMNVGIIFYAAQQTGDPELLRIATQHCLTTRRYLVRGDGSTAHEGIFDTETGEFLRQSTHQGWRDDSSWARGPGLGALRLRHRLLASRATRASCTRPRPAPTSTSSTRPPRRAAQRLGRAATRPCPTKARPPRSPPAACSTWPS